MAVNSQGLFAISKVRFFSGPDLYVAAYHGKGQVCVKGPHGVLRPLADAS